MFKLKVRGLAIFCAILALVYAGSSTLDFIIIFDVFC